MESLQQGDKNAGKSGAGAIERVAEAIFTVRVLETKIEAAGLEVFEIRATGDFKVAVLTGSPDFDVIGFGPAETQIACAKLDDTVMKIREVGGLSRRWR